MMVKHAERQREWTGGADNKRHSDVIVGERVRFGLSMLSFPKTGGEAFDLAQDDVSGVAVVAVGYVSVGVYGYQVADGAAGVH